MVMSALWLLEASKVNALDEPIELALKPPSVPNEIEIPEPDTPDRSIVPP